MAAHPHRRDEMELKALRARCDTRLRQLGELPARFDAAMLCELLAQRRGRPIVLQTIDAGVGPCGAWLACPSADLVLYERHTSALHQQHIILHEVSHLLCGHDAESVDASELSALLLPDVRPDVVQRVLRRTTYSAEDEREAELLASLILERISISDDDVAHDAAVPGLLGRLGLSLEDPPAEQT